EVAVLHGHQQWTGALPDGAVDCHHGPILLRLERIVHIHAGRKERTRRIDVAFAHGEEQRREPGLELCADIGTSIDQSSRDCRMPFGRGTHEGCLIAPLPGVGGGDTAKPGSYYL